MGCTKLTYQNFSFLQVIHPKKRVSAEKKCLKDYAGNYIYENDQLQFFNHAEGYTTPDGSGGFDYVYQYKDQVGNVRLSYSDVDGNGSVSTSEIIEESNYYPFGLIQKGYNSNVNSNGNSLAQKFKFGGKELSQELGLNSYDFGTRNYDAALGRWFNVDPLTEFMRNQSPYNYGFNNPIYFSDDGGNIPWPLPEFFKNWIRKGSPDSFFRAARSNHNGLDYNYNGGGNTDLGAPIVATHSGRVVRINPTSDGAGGRIVVIQSLDGTLETKYMHLSSIAVRVEDEIDEGQTIGLMGGSANGKELGRLVHLHYEIHVNNGNGFTAINPWVNGAPVDPQRLISTYGPWQDPNAYNSSDSFSIFDIPFIYEPKTPVPVQTPDPRSPAKAIDPGSTKPITPSPVPSPEPLPIPKPKPLPPSNFTPGPRPIDNEFY